MITSGPIHGSKEGRTQDYHFNKQADACERLGSLFTARLCRILPQILSDSSKTGNRVANWPGDPRSAALALRLCGALHRLVLSRRDAELAAAYPPNLVPDEKLRQAVLGAIERHDEQIALGLDAAPQTNEIARAGMLLPGFLHIGRETGLPLAICEIGASAGLNLLFDRFHYRYGDVCWGDENSPVMLSPDVHGMEPPLGGFLDIASREGNDLAPLDVADPDHMLRLKSFIWPDQALRLERLDAALSMAKHISFSLHEGDAADFVAEQLARRDRSKVFVLFHSIMWQYMPEEKRERIETLLDEAGNEAESAPIAWLRMEPVAIRDAFATLQVTLWPEAETRDLARCDYHGRWIELLGSGTS